MLLCQEQGKVVPNIFVHFMIHMCYFSAFFCEVTLITWTLFLHRKMLWERQAKRSCENHKVAEVPEDYSI